MHVALIRGSISKFCFSTLLTLTIDISLLQNGQLIKYFLVSSASFFFSLFFLAFDLLHPRRFFTSLSIYLLLLIPSSRQQTKALKDAQQGRRRGEEGVINARPAVLSASRWEALMQE